MTDIIFQELKVRQLKTQWDAACAKFDHYGTLPALLDMQTAKDELVSAENVLLEMKGAEHYDPYQPMNVTAYDAEQADHDDNLYPWRN